MTSLENIINKLVEFRKEREWEQFHNPKDLAISLNLEASELLEIFQWKNVTEMDFQEGTDNRQRITEELADIMNYVLLISHDLNIDIEEAALMKITKNAEKYPVEKSKGVATKYDKL